MWPLASAVSCRLTLDIITLWAMMDTQAVAVGEMLLKTVKTEFMASVKCSTDTQTVSNQ